MAKIEKKTLESIIKNGHLLGMISRERIWDEIKKSFDQSKDFNEYLKYLSDCNLLQYIFPGSNINTDFVDSDIFEVIISSLFKNEDINGLQNKLVQKYKIEYDLSKKIIFLLSFSKFKDEDVFDLFKKRQQCFISDETLLEWIKVNKLTDIRFKKFISYKPATSSMDLMSKGFKGPDLGREIKRLEIERFKEI